MKIKIAILHRGRTLDALALFYPAGRHLRCVSRSESLTSSHWRAVAVRNSQLTLALTLTLILSLTLNLSPTYPNLFLTLEPHSNPKPSVTQNRSSEPWLKPQLSSILTVSVTWTTITKTTKRMSYSLLYLFNANPGTNHNANPNVNRKW